ncbi:hypothetical protein POPTR_018G012850v4 [Populus trichocarpa]|uniref:Uncharacterized protein n=1 Tax=Populus trichocarpa TaxID=3694 RepID=A0A3N7HVL1_POPTR|nr:hypothetical protein POPTR_018G012850v4 [Populus trichocarpa]
MTHRCPVPFFLLSNRQTAHKPSDLFPKFITSNKKHTRFWPEIATPFSPKKEEPLAAEWRKVASEYMTTVMHLFLAYPQTHHRNPNGILTVTSDHPSDNPHKLISPPSLSWSPLEIPRPI